MRNLIVAALVVGILACTGPAAWADIAISSGTFATASPYLNSAAAADDYKANCLALKNGTLVNTVDFQPAQITLWSAATGYVSGGMAAPVTVINGLLADDIVKIDNMQSYRMESSGAWEVFWDQAPYWVKVSDYTHNATNTVNNWLISVSNNSDGTYAMTAGAGVYWLLDNEPVYADIGTAQLLQDRAIDVFRGATLLSPLTSGRGYTYSTAGISGGENVASDTFNSGAISAVPEPATMSLLALGLMGLVARRRNK